MLVIKGNNMYFRTLSLLIRKAPKMVVYSVALTAFTTVFPYVNIIISSALIDELINSRFKVLLLYAGILVFSDFLFGVIISWLQKKATRESECFLTFQTNLLAERSAYVPYEIFCGNECQNRRRELDELSEETGASLFSIIDLTKKIVGFSISLFAASITILNAASNVLRNESESSMNILIWLLFVNVLLIIISMISSWRIQRSQNYVEDRILPNYKIKWYLDREYLRFKKTAKEIRIFNQGPKVLKLFEDANRQINNVKNNFDKTVLYQNIIIEGAKQLSNLSIYIMFAAIALIDNITVGQFNKLTQATMSMYDNIVGFSVIISNYHRTKKWLRAFWHYYDTGVGLSGRTPNNDCRKDENLISFHNVEFKYNDSGRFSICNLNVSIEKGEHIAIVGKNGSGKSTLVMLMCGLLKPSQGEISVFGNEPTPVMFSAVFQDYNLFALPIKENVGVSCEPDLYKVVSAMRSAGVSERLINEQEAYLYRQLDPKGVEVSGGEGQKIAIARAFYKDTDVIIMDEPTSSLDPISEAMVYERIHSEYKDKTVVFISHRLSSCKFCDRVLVMESGSIIQEGTHDKLIEDFNGRYCELWNAQARYYQA